MKTLKEIEKMQNRDNVKYEAAKKIVLVLEEAKKAFEKAGGSSEDWDDVTREIAEIVFDE